jgi:hypothetical protein
MLSLEGTGTKNTHISPGGAGMRNVHPSSGNLGMTEAAATMAKAVVAAEANAAGGTRRV